jgi:hypothetical protein
MTTKTEEKVVVDPLEINPVKFFNEQQGQWMFNWFISRPLAHFTSVNSFSYTKVKEDKKKAQIIFEDDYFKCVKPCDLEMEVGDLYTPFDALVKFRFKGNYQRAISFIVYELMNYPIPYIRVGYKYFKRIKKKDRNDIVRTELKVWDKVTICDDYGKPYLNRIASYDDFTINPDNKSYDQIVGNNYNLYSPFEHKAAESFTEDDIKWTSTLLKHIFGEQYEIGLKYVKVLYDLPAQKLPILVLTSEERSTGKTTFLDWLDLLFGANAVIINPQDISNSFNGTYATSNIIMIEESRFDSTQALEKLKNLATQKKIMVNTKFVNQYSIPFHGKLIITSNDERKFSRIDESEIRYWIRKIPTLKGKANHNILNDLKNEIPYFLAKLNSMPPVDTSKSRMVFESENIQTEALRTVKKESRSAVRKDIELYIEELGASNTDHEYIYFVAGDIKDKWFKHSRVEVSYIRNVLRNEIKLKANPVGRYNALCSPYKDSNGRYYQIINPHYNGQVPEEERKI